MAFATITFMSKIFRRKVTFSALIPRDYEFGERNNFVEGKPLKTVYLLHGYSGNHTDWINYSRIHELSGKLGLAVIMPSGENNFYLDDVDKKEFWSDFIGKELVEFTRSIFPLSCKREDTYIAGLSMGGYGALRNGLKYSDTFSKIASFSGAHIVLNMADTFVSPDDGITDEFKRRIFGEYSELRYSDKDPRYLIESLRKEGKSIPELLITCGEQDFLVQDNEKLCAYLSENQVPFVFIGGEGAHDWEYWNKNIEYACQWLVDGKNSSCGNTDKLLYKK